MVITANVESVSGGSMRIAPGAGPHDGMLWVTIVEAKPKLTMMLKVLPKVASGNHIKEEGLHYFSAPRMEITSDVPSGLDPDGELKCRHRRKRTPIPTKRDTLVFGAERGPVLMKCPL